MPQLIRDEIDILYAISNRLTQASTPVEWLEAVSSYARDHGATSGALFWITYDSNGQPQWAEVAAAWVAGRGMSANVGVRLFIPDYQGFVSVLLSTPDRPALIPNITDDSIVGPAGREAFAHFQMQAAAILPLNIKGRWIGVLAFGWANPHEFDERDHRIFRSIMRQAAPVIDSVRLFEQSRERAVRAEQLLKISTALSQATNEAEILAAVALYADQQKPDSLTLSYLESDERGEPFLIRNVAVWGQGQIRSDAVRLSRTYRLSDLGLSQLWVEQNDRVMLIEDALTDPRIDEFSRAMMLNFQIRAFATIPLHSGGRWQGLLNIQWSEPRLYTDEEKYIYSELMQSIPAVIATRRAYLAEEEARRESELLYRTSEAINAATTFADIAQAAARLADSSQTLALGIFENYDFDTATYVEIVAASPASPWEVGARYPLDAFPVFERMARQGVTVYEGAPDDGVVDPVSISTMIRHNMLASINVSLSLNNRWMGILSFQSPQPREYRASERRLLAGIGDLMAAALERIRLQAETESARQRAETLAQINAALSQANDEQGILDAMAALAERYGAVLSSLAYIDVCENGEPDTLRVVALRFGDQSRPLPASGLPAATFRPQDYPLLQLVFATPDEPVFVENTLTDPRTEADKASEVAQPVTWQAAILIPLKMGDQWQAVLTFAWEQPQTFTPEVRTLFKATRPTASSVVATRRAYLAEEKARQESEFLYQASERINAAMSFAEITAAVAQLRLFADGIALGVWEGFDYDAASFVEIWSTNENRDGPTDRRFAIKEVPVVYTMAREDLLVVENSANPEQIDALTAQTLDSLGTHAFINVPIRLGTRWLGNLAFSSRTPRIFTSEEKRLVEGIGGLVTAALERIRLQLETEAARERAELLLQVNAALSQANDEESILAAVALLSERYGVALSHLAYFTVDQPRGTPQEMQIVALRFSNGVSLSGDVLPASSFRAEFYPLFSLIRTRSEEPLFIEDLAVSPGRSGAENLSGPMNWTAAIVLPLKTGDHWQGALSFFWDEQPQTFPPEVRSMFAAIRPTASSVVTSRRAYLAEQKAHRENELRASELETVAKVSAATTTILDVNELLRTVTSLTRSSFNLYHVHIYLLDDSGENLVLATSTDEMAAVQDSRVTLHSDQSLVARAGRKRHGTIVDGIPAVPDLSKLKRGESLSKMAVPMVVADKLIGVLDVQAAHGNRFTEADVRVMSTLADLIGVAVQNARLYKQAQELAALEERNRLARELHDSVSQALFGIALGARTAHKLLDRDPAKVAEPLEYVLSLAEAGLTEMRALIFELRPETLENEGLIAALTKQAESMQVRHGIAVYTEFCDEPPLPLVVKEALYRIAREALHNTVKHARATTVTLNLQHTDEGFMLEITDNGSGFDPGGSFPGHLGLKSMRERTARLNGIFQLESSPGAGARIRVDIPRGRR